MVDGGGQHARARGAGAGGGPLDQGSLDQGSLDRGSLDRGSLDQEAATLWQHAGDGTASWDAFLKKYAPYIVRRQQKLDDLNSLIRKEELSADMAWQVWIEER